MRTIKKIILAIVLFGIVLVAVANRQVVSVQLLPDEIGSVLGTNATISLPLFVILGAAIVVGLLLGYLFEWLRERKHRQAVTTSQRKVTKLESEVEKLRKKTGEGEDDVLALLN